MSLKPYKNTRTLVDFTQLSTNGACFFVPLPRDIWRVMLKLWGDRGNWISTYYIETLASGYVQPDEVDFGVWLSYANNAIEEAGEDMSCTSGLIDAINALVAATANNGTIAQNCCAGPGGGFISDGAGGFYYGSEEPIIPPALPTPDEISQRCLGANLIVEGLVATLNTMSSYSLAVLVLGTIVSFFVAPPAVAVLVTITALAGFGLDVFEDIADDIESNKAEWVCVLYSAGSYSTVVAFIEEQAVAIANALSFSILGVPLGQMLASMIPTNVFNQMFQEVGFLPPASAPVSCAGCVQDDIWACVASVSCGGAGVLGTITAGNPNNGEACTVTSGTYWWSCNPGTPVPAVCLEGIVDIQITAFSSSINLRYWDELGTVAYYQLSNTTSPVGTMLAAGNQLFIMRNDGGAGAFTINITVGAQ